MFHFFKLALNRQQWKNLIKYNKICERRSASTLTIKEMPHPRSLPIIGTKLDFLVAGSTMKLHKYIDLRHKQLGSIFYEKLGGSTNMVFTSDPVLVRTLFLKLDGKYPSHILPEPWILYEKLYGSKRGLFFMDGEEWLRNRRVMNRHLLREGSEKWIENPIRGTIEKFIQNWKLKVGSDSFMPDLESEFYRLSTDIVISVLLGENSTFTTTKHHEELMIMFSDYVKKIFQTTTKFSVLPATWCYRLNLKIWRDFKESVDMSLLLANKIVKEMLTKNHESNGLIKKLTDENVPKETIIRIVADFVIAAGDTTAYTSLWILYLLSKNDEVLKELRERDRSYAKCVVKESMRLYPVAPFLTRILPKESILGCYKLNEGTPIIASIYTSGRDEKNFSKADNFLPFRWDRNDPRRNSLTNHINSASLPFALGSRSCIGKKIAMIQLTEVINQIVDNFNIKCANSTSIDSVTSQVLVPNSPIRLVVSLRK